MVRGSCLCGGIAFEVSGPRSDIAFCHCSLCRKRSGVGSVATVNVDFDKMKWISGERLVTVWVRHTGATTVFCRVCGSPAPEADDAKTFYRIPVGLFDGDPPLGILDHIFVGSKASWEIIADGAPQYDEMGPRSPRNKSF